jgi:ubiquitin C-terminal hydrolase
MREFKGWYRFDDKLVRRIEKPEETDYMTSKGSGTPYILIYQRIEAF